MEAGSVADIPPLGIVHLLLSVKTLFSPEESSDEKIIVQEASGPELANCFRKP